MRRKRKDIEQFDCEAEDLLASLETDGQTAFYILWNDGMYYVSNNPFTLEEAEECCDTQPPEVSDG